MSEENKKNQENKELEEWRGPKGKGGLGVALDLVRRHRKDGPVTVPRETSGLIFPKSKKNRPINEETRF